MAEVLHFRSVEGALGGLEVQAGLTQSFKHRPQVRGVFLEEAAKHQSHHSDTPGVTTGGQIHEVL